MKKDYLKPIAEVVKFYTLEETTAISGEKGEESIPEDWEE